MGLIIGIMGCFASGKSLAARFFKDMGFYEIDGDEIGKEALRVKKNEIIDVFGNDILDKDEISSKKLGDIVFPDTEKMNKLNRIVHPWMKDQVKKIIEKKSPQNIFIHAAILPQIGLHVFCDIVLMIEVHEDIMIGRGMKRNQFSPDRIRKILNMQKRNNDYSKVTDYVLENNTTKEDFINKIKEFYIMIKEETHDTSRGKSKSTKKS